MADSEQKNLETELQALDPSRRDFLRRVVLTTAFVVPVVSSFGIDGMLVSKALAIGNPLNSSVPVNGT